VKRVTPIVRAYLNLKREKTSQPSYAYSCEVCCGLGLDRR
jgi:hypothetical protein